MLFLVYEWNSMPREVGESKEYRFYIANVIVKIKKENHNGKNENQ